MNAEVALVSFAGERTARTASGHPWALGIMMVMRGRDLQQTSIFSR